MSRLAFLLIAATLICQAQAQSSSDADKQIANLLADAQAAETRHDDVAAVSKYEAILEILKQHPALEPGLEGLALERLSRAEVRLGHLDRAAQVDERRVAASRQDTNGEAAAAIPLSELMGIYVRLHRMSDAKRCFEEASQIFDGCLFYPANAMQKKNCAEGKWDLFAVWGGILFGQNRDAEAEPVLRAVANAPETEVRPEARFLALRFEATLLARNGKEKESTDMSQRASDYERQHPDVAAKASAALITPALQKDPNLRGALLKLNEMDKQLMMGTLKPDDDFSTLGPYADALQLVRDNLYKQQQEILETRAELAALKLSDVLAPATLATSEGRAASHDKLRKAKTLEARLAVVSQESTSSTEEALYEKAQGPYTPEERTAFNVILSQIVNSLGYVYRRASEVERESVQLLGKEDEFIAGVDRRAGHFSLQNGKLVFDSPDDDATYNAAMSQFKAWAARIVALQQQLINEIQKHDADANQMLSRP